MLCPTKGAANGRGAHTRNVADWRAACPADAAAGREPRVSLAAMRSRGGGITVFSHHI